MRSRPPHAGVQSSARKAWEWVKWWRRRESNPRPLAFNCRLYMLSLVYPFDRSPPDGQGCDRRAR